MQSTQDLIEQAGLDYQFREYFPYYLEITEGQDEQFRSELSGDIFATNKNQEVLDADQLLYNEKMAAYSVGLLFYLLQNHDLIELTKTKMLLDKYKDKDQYQTYGCFQFFKTAFTIQLKSLEDHINSLIGDNNIQHIYFKDYQFGAFYTFVRQCKLDVILWKLKVQFDQFVPHCHFESALQYNESKGQFDASIYTFQSSAEQLCHSLLRESPYSLEQQFQQNIKKYNLDILQLALTDTTYTSVGSQALLVQRSKPQFHQFLELFQDHPFLVFKDIKQQFQKNRILMNYHQHVILKIEEDQGNYSQKFQIDTSMEESIILIKFVLIDDTKKNRNQLLSDNQNPWLMQNKKLKSSIIQRYIEDDLLLDRIYQIMENQVFCDKKIKFQLYANNAIELRGLENIVNNIVKELDNIIQNESAKQKTINIQIYTKVWDYLIEVNSSLLQDFERQNKCSFNIKDDNTNNGQNRAQLQLNDQFFIIRQGDIIKQHCDVITHFFNNQLEASDKILKFGGSQYKKHAENLLSGLSTLIDEIHYKVPNSNTIKHIISIPLFQNSISDIQVQFKNNIQLMFSVADKQEFKSLVIQIQSIQENDLRILFNEILIQMQNSKFIKNIVIMENQELKIDILVKELKEILNPKIFRQIKFQWQWYDEGWKDYDDEEINRQIDEAYEQYQNNNNQNEIKLFFPYTKLPGTHTVDLHNMIVTNISTYQTENISYNNHQYFFNGMPVDQQLNQYIEIQKLSNQLKFQIFFKRYKIVFKNQNKIIQINQDTKYERKIRFQLYQKQQIQQYPIEALYQFEEFQIKQNSLEYIELVVKGYAQESIINAQSFINDLIDQNTSTIKWDVINLDDHEYIQVEQEIKKRSIYYKGQVGPLNKIKIYSLKQENQQLADYLKKLTSSYNQIYPKIWKPQNINMIKVELSQNDENIKKIQNKILYENFQTEKQKLIKLKQQQGQQLTQIELERYIWHGVSNQHPQIIYSGLKEAFDCTYCQDYCLWGSGIYFAENSSYSKSYSYTLSLKDSPQYSGKLIFLLCLVATGKVKKLDSDKSLKRPPDGYDCVQGQSGGSDIYILYQMDVRRAYPAYEVIYE